MSIEAQTRLLEDIRKSINYCIDEYNVSYAEVVGVLMLAIQHVSASASDKEQENDNAT